MLMYSHIFSRPPATDKNGWPRVTSILEPESVSAGHLASLISAPSIIYVRRVFFQRGAEFFFQEPKGGPEFFPVGKGGTKIFWRMQRGDPKKLATGRHRQVAPPLPLKNDSSLIVKFNFTDRKKVTPWFSNFQWGVCMLRPRKIARVRFFCTMLLRLNTLQMKIQ